MVTAEEREQNDLSHLENDEQRRLYLERKAARAKFNDAHECLVGAQLAYEAAQEELSDAERAFAQSIGLGVRSSRLP